MCGCDCTFVYAVIIECVVVSGGWWVVGGGKGVWRWRMRDEVLRGGGGEGGENLRVRRHCSSRHVEVYGHVFDPHTQVVPAVYRECSEYSECSSQYRA
jgi:hypothetical protein